MSSKIGDIANKDNRKKVFISYAREDCEAALRIYNDLTNAGLDPWLDKKHILPGQNWEVTIKKAIRESRYFFALLSSRSTSKKGFIQREVKIALDILDEYPEEEIYFIPVRLDECEIKYEKLRNRQYVNMFPDWDDGLTQILRSTGVISSTNLTEAPAVNPAEIRRDFEAYEDKLQHVTSPLTMGFPAVQAI